LQPAAISGDLSIAPLKKVPEGMQRTKRQVLIELLVIQSQTGDAHAVENLANICQSNLVAYALRLVEDRDDARDVVQEAWISIIRSIHQLQDPAAFTAWALRIVHGKSMDLLRKKMRERKHLKNVSEQPKANTSALTINRDATDEVTELLIVIQRLPPADRSLLHLFYSQSLSINEISAITGASRASIKSKLFHLRKKIKMQIERQNHE
jgi:RNA polymerase sigma factor (sigma-70 family)